MHTDSMSVCLFDVCDLSVKCILNEKKGKRKKKTLNDCNPFVGFHNYDTHQK